MNLIEESRLITLFLSGTQMTTVIILIILILLSSFFSASETAISSVNKVRIKLLAEKGKKSARRLMSLTEKYDRTLSTILIGNNLVNIAIATLAVGLFANFILNPNTVDLVSTLVSTVVVLIFGEILPKTLAKQHPEGVSLVVATPIYYLDKILLPLTYFFTFLKRVILRDRSKEENTEIPSDENELGIILDEMQEKGILNEEENDFLHCVLTLNDKSVSDIMVPRVDMIMISVSEPIAVMKQVFLDTKFSRIPIYNKDKDDVIGILYERDFFTYLLTNQPFEVRKILRPTQFVPKTLKVDNLIKELKRTKTHIAIVVDEFGGTDGLVTMEDALEEIVGEIYDEHDDKEKKLITALENNEYLIDLDLDLSQLFDEFNLGKTPETEFYKVGGWLLELSEDFPKIDDLIDFDIKFSYYDDELEDYVVVSKRLIFQISEIHERRLTKAKLKIEDITEEENQNKE